MSADGVDPILRGDDLAIALGLSEPEPARIICRETDFGRGITCAVIFAGRFLATSELSSRQHPLRRQEDADRIKRETWKQFWRYIGAA